MWKVRKFRMYLIEILREQVRLVWMSAWYRKVTVAFLVWRWWQHWRGGQWHGLVSGDTGTCVRHTPVSHLRLSDPLMDIRHYVSDSLKVKIRVWDLTIGADIPVEILKLHLKLHLKLYPTGLYWKRSKYCNLNMSPSEYDWHSLWSSCCSPLNTFFNIGDFD